MFNVTKVLISIAIMAIVTYLLRMIPLVAFKNQLTNRFVRSFLYYVPYAVLAAMTIPEMLFATNGIYSALAGLVVAVVLALFEKGLLTVAIASCVAVFITQLFI